VFVLLCGKSNKQLTSGVQGNVYNHLRYTIKTNKLLFIRRRHVVEMMNMAQRPYSSVILDSTRENLSEAQSQKTVIKNKSMLNKKDINYMPIAVEITSDNQAAVCTVFIQLPGQKRNVCVGSSLILSPKNVTVFLNKPLPRISQQVV
jgi:hypothetical protein